MHNLWNYLIVTYFTVYLYKYKNERKLSHYVIRVCCRHNVQYDVAILTIHICLLKDCLKISVLNYCIIAF